MSAADDKSLLAMKAAKMSTGSIAFTMGWSPKRVERRLAELEEARAEGAKADADAATITGSLEGVSVPRRPLTPERRPPNANLVRTPSPAPSSKPLQAGQGMVERTFQTRDGCGAAVRLGDGHLAFTECGTHDLDHGRTVKVQPADGCFHLIPERARG